MDYSNLINALIEGNSDQLLHEIDRLLGKDLAPDTIIDEGMLEGMKRVGELFKEGELFLPEVMMSAQAMSDGVDRLQPLIQNNCMKGKGIVAIGTVKGDLHDIGKNLVTLFMRTNGYEVIDLGTDVHPERFIEAVEKHGVQILGLSALLTTTMETMKDIIEMLKEKNIRHKTKVIVGGAPLSDAYAMRIGADGYAKDATSAVELCSRLLSEEFLADA